MWEGRWHIGSISKEECWKLGAKITITFAGGVPEIDVEFDAKRISVAEVVRKILEGIKPTTTSGGVEIQKETTALGRCKCIGPQECSRIFEVCFKTRKDCRESQKDLEKICNGPEVSALCDRPKCRPKHDQARCPVDCEPGPPRQVQVSPAGGGSSGGGGTIPGLAKNCTDDDSCSNDINSPQSGTKPIVDGEPRNVNINDSKHTRMAKKNIGRLKQLASSTRCTGFTQQCEQDFCEATKPSAESDCKSQIDSATRSLNRYRDLVLAAFREAESDKNKPPKSGDWSIQHTADSEVGIDMSSKSATSQYTVHVTVRNNGKDFNATHLFPGHGKE